MAVMTRKKAKETLAKLHEQGILLRLDAQTELQWKDEKGVLTQEKTAYLRRHKDALADALFREQIDEHLPDDIKAEMLQACKRQKRGCFSIGKPCHLFTSEELEKSAPSEILKDAKKREKAGHRACGECDLWLAQMEQDKLSAARRKKEEREEARQWANAQTSGRYDEEGEY